MVQKIEATDVTEEEALNAAFFERADEFIKQGFHPTNSSFFPFVVSPLPTIYSRLRTYPHTCASCICTLPIILSSHTALCSPSLGSLTDLCFTYQIPFGHCLETLHRYTLC